MFLAFVGQEVILAIRLHPQLFAWLPVASVPMWFVYIKMDIYCRSLPDIGGLSFDAIFFIHMGVGILSHSVSRDFLVIFVSVYIITTVVSTSTDSSRFEFIFLPLGLS